MGQQKRDKKQPCPPHFWQLDGKYVGVCKKCQMVKVWADPSRTMTQPERRVMSRRVTAEIAEAKRKA